MRWFSHCFHSVLFYTCYECVSHSQLERLIVAWTRKRGRVTECRSYSTCYIGQRDGWNSCIHGQHSRASFTGSIHGCHPCASPMGTIHGHHPEASSTTVIQWPLVTLGPLDPLPASGGFCASAELCGRHAKALPCFLATWRQAGLRRMRFSVGPAMLP